MHDANECRRKADALATLAEMFPENGDRYRAKERHWRDQEMMAQEQARLVIGQRNAGTISPQPDSSVEGSPP